MREYKSVSCDRIPCWYELSWRPKLGIVLRIHQDFVKNTKPITSNAPIVKQFKKDFGFVEFGPILGEDFGFERILKFLGNKNQFLEYQIPVTVCKKTTDDACSSCEGSGKNLVIRGKCIFCDGKGKNVIYNYSQAYAVSASISLLFQYLAMRGKETSASVNQLIQVETVTIAQSHGGSLFGEINEDVVIFLRKRQQNEIPEMVNIMRKVYAKMDGGRLPKFYDYSFQAYIQDRERLIVNCPGDACGLHPAESSSDSSLGYRFSCHNVDQPMQQMSLLSSLAVLHNLVRDTKL